MSVQAMGWVLNESKATGNARMVLLSIGNHAGATGENAWPSVDTIAAECGGISPSTVQRAIKTLEVLGELYVYEQAVVHRRCVGTGAPIGTRCQLCQGGSRLCSPIHGVSFCCPVGRSHELPRGVKKPGTGCHISRHGVSPVLPKPS